MYGLNHPLRFPERQQIAWSHCLPLIHEEASVLELLERANHDVNAAVFDRFDLSSSASQLTRTPLAEQRGELWRFSERGFERPDGIWVVSEEGQKELRYLPRVNGFFEAPEWIASMSCMGFDAKSQAYRNGFEPCPTYFAQRLPNPSEVHSAIWNLRNMPERYVNA